MDDWNISKGLIFVMLLTPNVSCGQGSPKLEFEVASFRPANPGDPRDERPVTGVRSGGPGTSSPTRITFLRVPLERIIEYAFDLSQRQISGPEWITTARYDITANVAEGSTELQARQMLQNLLVQRLGLAFHMQKKAFPGYELRVSGATVNLNESGPTASEPQAVASSQTTDGRGFPILPQGEHSGMRSNSGHVRFKFREAPISDLARALGMRLPTEFVPGPLDLKGSLRVEGGTVVDATGLTGVYSFTLDYAGSTFAMPGQLPFILKSIRNALENQLGLTLVEAKVSLDILVIERVQKIPTED